MEAGRSGPAELWPLAAGLLLLALFWFRPLPDRARGSFAAHMVMHMVMHMGVLAVAAPLLAVGIACTVPRLVSSFPLALAIMAPAVEFVAVWTWRAPALHDAARVEPTFLVLEQVSFLAAVERIALQDLVLHQLPRRRGTPEERPLSLSRRPARMVPEDASASLEGQRSGAARALST
ncbi:hypothetical protein [Skermanella pratensis]|uniref:hypothetical protein n=1 Tax=Skermanella pratensis TaxID=2233999 RepID=UPI001FE8BD57|nr:hypothetical protein [Skermanella pratensis]